MCVKRCRAPELTVSVLIHALSSVDPVYVLGLCVRGEGGGRTERGK